MLSMIRKGTSSIFVMILMGLLIVSFAIWGMGDVFRFGGGNAVVTVGDQKIAAEDFARQFQNEINRFRQQFGADFSVSQARELGLSEQVLQRMVNRAVFDHAATDLGMRASDGQVYRLIHDNEAFRNSFGEFDIGLYEAVLRYSDMTVRQFESAARDDVTRDQLLRTMASAAGLPENLMRRLYAYHGEERTIDVLRFRASSAEAAPEPTEDDLRAFYDANRTRYMAPEYRALSLIVLTPDAFTDDVTVTEDDLADYYQANIGRYSQADSRLLEQIVFGSEDDAQKAYDAVTGGADFSAVASDMAGLSAEDLRLGNKTREDLEQDLGTAAADAVFGLDAPGVVPPVQSDFGWHLLRVTEIRGGSTRSLDDARPEIERAALLEKALDMFYEYANRIEDELASGSSLADIAKMLEVPLRQVPAVDAEGRAPDGQSVAAVNVPGLLEQAFATEPGIEPNLIEASQDLYYLLSVEDMTPAAERPFEDVRQAVRSNWQSEQRNIRARQAADAARDALAGGADMAAVAADAEVQRGLRVGRIPGPTTANVAPELRKTAFELNEGGLSVTPAADGDGFLVVRVGGITPGDFEKAGPLYVEFARGMDFQYGNDVLMALQLHLAREYDVRVNRVLIDQTLNQLASGPN